MITIRIKIRDNLLPEAVAALKYGGGYEQAEGVTDEAFIADCIAGILKDMIKAYRRSLRTDDPLTLE